MSDIQVNDSTVLDEFKEEFEKSDREHMDLFLADKVREQQKEIQSLKAFYDYFAELYGDGLEVANWHLNGDLEPFDDFFENAVQEMNIESGEESQLKDSFSLYIHVFSSLE